MTDFAKEYRNYVISKLDNLNEQNAKFYNKPKVSASIINGLIDDYFKYFKDEIDHNVSHENNQTQSEKFNDLFEYMFDEDELQAFFNQQYILMIQNEINELTTIIHLHNQKPMSLRDSWLKLENNEIIIKSDVNGDYTNGIEILAQIVPEWANCSSDALDADSLEDVETSLADPYYDDINEEKPADIFKADYRLIFVSHDWASGEEQVSDHLADVMDLFTECSVEKD